jgi:alpha-amylase
MRCLPEELARRGAGFLTPSEALARWGEQAHHLPLPVFPSTWAGTGGMEFFLGNQAQQALLSLMGQVLGVARLTGDSHLLDLALWLTQSDNLHLIQWHGRGGAEAEVSAYFTPGEWWQLGPDRIIVEQQRVYFNALRAMELYLPGRSHGAKVSTPTEPLAVEARY